MDEKNYIDLPESIDQNIPQTYKFDSALKPQRIIRLPRRRHSLQPRR